MSGPERQRLTEREKKENHLASERRRREAIRKEFDALCEIVPGMKGLGRSEHTVLDASLEFIRAKVAENKKLVERARAAGHNVDALCEDQKTYEEAEQQVLKQAMKQAARDAGEEVDSSDDEGEELKSPRGNRQRKSLSEA